MIIYFLDKDPRQAALFVCDQHVNTQIKRCLTLLSTAHYLLGEENDKHFKAAFRNHPISKWVREARNNYNWVYSYLVTLMDVYKDIRGHDNQYLEVANELSRVPHGIPHNYHATGPTSPPNDFLPEFLQSKQKSWVVDVIDHRVHYEHYELKDMNPTWNTGDIFKTLRRKPEWYKKVRETIKNEV